MSVEWREGQAVTWRAVSPGGYGYATLVPAKVLRIGRCRVTISAMRANGTWAKRSVDPKNLTDGWRVTKPERRHPLDVSAG